MVAVLVGWAVAGGSGLAGAAEDAAKGPEPKMFHRMVERGIGFLVSRQGPDGSLSPQIGIGPTALATLGLLRSGIAPADPRAAKGLAYLVKSAQQNGGIHKPGTFIATYETCIAMMCLKEANRSGKYDKIIAAADKFVRDGQWDEADGRDSSDRYYGGSGYGGSTRPDLSNTAFLMDALKAVGAGPQDEAMQRAMTFVSRCQNLETEHNTTEFAGKVNDGGFYYTCVLSGQDESRQTPNGGLRSYGSMTYAGLKSMIYAGLTPDDPRVKAAVEWVGKHYDVKTNPGMGQAGVYYYYHTFAKALDAVGEDLIVDSDGVRHDWRRELAEELARRQQENGSWVNSDTRWMEGDANLATSFALLALSYCQPKGN